MITDLQLAQIRRMVSEPVTSSGLATYYTDTTISGYYDTYGDLYAVAAEIWAEKASYYQSTAYDFSADGGTYSVNQIYQNAVDKARYYSSKRKAKTSLWTKAPEEVDEDEEI